MTPAITRKESKWPVIEIFGPTIQGEGVDQGVVCHFVRFGGCDYRCTWCDTPFAVLPEEVRANSTKMGATEIVHELNSLSVADAPDNAWRVKAPWVILSGGNPALHDLAPLVDALHEAGYLVAVETQGSRWREWMSEVDRLCVSPKPPSSLEPKASNLGQLQRFLHEGMLAKVNGDRPYEWIFLKVVCFNEEDLEFAIKLREQFSDSLLYLSVGNDAGRTVGNPTREDAREVKDVRHDLLENTAWLIAEVFKRPELCVADVYVQHQLHTAVWGNGQGF